MCALYILVFFVCFPAILSHGNVGSWIESMNNCEPGYLFGKVDLRVPSQYCNLSTDAIDVHWIGVARQKYKSEDQGASLKHNNSYYMLLNIMHFIFICQSFEKIKTFSIHMHHELRFINSLQKIIIFL